MFSMERPFQSVLPDWQVLGTVILADVHSTYGPYGVWYRSGVRGGGETKEEEKEQQSWRHHACPLLGPQSQAIPRPSPDLKVD